MGLSSVKWFMKSSICPKAVRKDFTERSDGKFFQMQGEVRTDAELR